MLIVTTMYVLMVYIVVDTGATQAYREFYQNHHYNPNPENTQGWGGGRSDDTETSTEDDDNDQDYQGYQGYQGYQSRVIEDEHTYYEAGDYSTDSEDDIDLEEVCVYMYMYMYVCMYRVYHTQ